jgi:protein-S-isoprenylcysteine O-methyltransferase Ste14
MQSARCGDCAEYKKKGCRRAGWGNAFGLAYGLGGEGWRPGRCLSRHPLDLPADAAAARNTRGIFFKHPSWLAGVLAAAATGFLVATAKADEAENIRFFGPSYQEYMMRTKMFVPFLF